MPYFRWKAQNLDLKYYTTELNPAVSFASAYKLLLRNSPVQLESGVLEANDLEDVALILLHRGLIPVLLAEIGYEQYIRAKKVDDKIDAFKRRSRRERKKDEPRLQKPKRHWGLIILLAVILIQSTFLVWLAIRL